MRRRSNPLEVFVFFKTLVESSFQSNRTMQSVESKKEEFQKYLEKAGVVDALTKGMSLE
jgi:hypothetical protein